MNGMLLDGIARVSLATPPDPANPVDAAIPFDVSVALAGPGSAAPPTCITDSSDRVVAYHCVITTTLGRWSGRSVLVPRGWTIGTSPADRKVCRYSADQDGSGTVDTNAEHPNEYTDVDRPLTQQNFLIVRGDQPCPIAAKGNNVFADLSTIQHQP